MAIKIIKRGIPQKEKTYTISCIDCKSRFSFQREDAIYFSDQRDGETLSIHCPVCNARIWVAK